MTDSLATLNRVRKLAVDQARSHLTAVVAIENAAKTHVDEADAKISHEVAVASELSAGDYAVEAFAEWLPIGRAKASEARFQHERSLLDVACARAGLTAALIAAEATQNYLELREAEHRAVQDKRNQLIEDDVAGQMMLRSSRRTMTNPS